MAVARLLTLLPASLLLALLLLSCAYQPPPNRCSMTYMRPQLDLVQRRHAASALWRYTELPRPKTAQIPANITSIVVFVHGHGGHPLQVSSLIPPNQDRGNKELHLHLPFFFVDTIFHPAGFAPPHAFSLPLSKQIRSLGSFLAVAPHRWIFSVDFRDQPSALSAHLRQQQTDELRAYMSALAANYSQAQIAFVGHSMGAVVVLRALCETSRPQWASQVSLVLALAAPLVAPLWPGDWQALREYQTLHQTMRVLPPDLRFLLVSVSSGSGRDFFVMDQQTDLRRVIGDTAQASHVATSTEALWSVAMPVDHQCILWCRELMATLARLVVGLESAWVMQGPRPAALLQAAQHHLPNRPPKHPTATLLSFASTQASLCHQWILAVRGRDSTKSGSLLQLRVHDNHR